MSMSQPDAPSRIRSLKVHALLLGAVLSVAVHASAILVIDIAFWGRSSSQFVQPTQHATRGEPIQVFFRPDDLSEPTEKSPTPADASRLALSRLSQQATLVPPLSPEVRTPVQTQVQHANSPASFMRSNQAVRTGETHDWSISASSSDPVNIPPADLPILVPAIASAASLSLTTAMPELVETHNSAYRAPEVPIPAQRRGVDTKVRAMDVSTPIYPQRSVRQGQEGDVEVIVQVLASGRVGSVRIHRPSKHRLLNESALKAAKKASFKPATSDGKPIDSEIILPFEFRLH